MKYTNNSKYYNPNNYSYSEGDVYQNNSASYNNVRLPVEDSYPIDKNNNENISMATNVQNSSCACNSNATNPNSNCNNNGGSLNNNSNNDDELCGGKFCNISPAENCCNGMLCSIDPSQLKCICTYLDIIYSECGAQGTPIIIPITLANSSSYSITQDYKPCSSKCCYSCSVNSSSVYTIERMKVSISSINLITLPSTSKILIDSVPVLNIMPNSNGSLSATINSSVENEDCNDSKCGTKSSVLLNTIGGWSFFAKYELCGKVTTSEGNCKFSINMDTLTTIPITTTDTSTFACPEICIPDLDENTSTYLNIKFDADAQLINPVITIGENGLQLNTTLLLNPKARVETIKNCKVCLSGNIYNSK